VDGHRFDHASSLPANDIRQGRVSDEDGAVPDTDVAGSAFSTATNPSSSIALTAPCGECPLFANVDPTASPALNEGAFRSGLPDRRSCHRFQLRTSADECPACRPDAYLIAEERRSCLV
jgi:hypothetical protein